MTTTVQVIVNNGIYLSLQDREFEPSISGARSNIALDILQGLFDEYRDLIPFATVVDNITDFDDLLNTDFVQIDYLNYWLSNVKTPLRQLDAIVFNEEKDIKNLRTFPECFYFDPLTQSIQVYPLPTPNANNYFEVRGMIALGDCQLTTPIPANMPRFFRDFFEYELGFRLANLYNSDWSATKEMTRKSLLNGVERKRQISITPRARLEFVSPTSQALYPPYFYYSSGGGQRS